MSETEVFIVVLAVVVFIMWVASVPAMQPGYPQATGIFPQVVSCVPEHEPQRHSGPNWQPTVKVTVEPGRDPGRVREYRVLGFTLYYYHAHF